MNIKSFSSVLLALALALCLLATGCDGSGKQKDRAGATATPAAAATPPPGQALYAANCAVCHQPDGRGVMGSYPPLDGSEWLAGEPDAPIAIVLMGLKGEVSVKGELFDSEMPPLETLPDAELADILTYVRASWSNSSGAVTPEQVAEMRQRLTKRNQSWDGEAELREFLGVKAPPVG